VHSEAVKKLRWEAEHKRQDTKHKRGLSKSVRWTTHPL